MTASIEDVAKRAGVSIATVSRSLRGLPDVAPATRDRVLIAAQELDYVASPFAARLASGRTSTVGVVVPFVNRWFFAETLGAVEAVLNQAGFDLLLYNLGDRGGRTRFFTALPVRKRVDALVVATIVPSAEEIEALRSLDCLTGILGVEMPGFLSVCIDDVGSATVAVTHLLERGHRRIGLVGGDTDDPMRFTAPLRRRDGYLDALTAAGIAYDPALEVLGYFTVDGGRSAGERLLDLPDPPTAIFAESDEMAYGVMKAIRRRGLRVGHDVAVIGFDDHASAELLDLSTIRQPVVEQATRLTQRLLAGVADAQLDPTSELLATELIVRGSTDPAASVY